VAGGYTGPCRWLLPGSCYSTTVDALARMHDDDDVMISRAVIICNMLYVIISNKGCNKA
jgi:hypothetical protein